MGEFPFARTELAYQFCQRVKDALLRFCGKTEAEAVQLIGEYWAHRENIEEDRLLFHEVPYYYAMCMAHHPVIGDNNPFWWKDPHLWPPPKGWHIE
ncbi:MAG TPA: hypothetical protein VEL76_20755 [Gemmataceae bacterium]|nr:hypothetical protein [Gemmataceae bacterium]